MNRDDGSATILAAAMIVVLLTVVGGVVGLDAVITGRHRAQAAADLAALAGAEALPSGIGLACARAVLVARRTVAGRVDCRVDGSDVLVTVEVRFGSFGSVRAAARAGP